MLTDNRALIWKSCEMIITEQITVKLQSLPPSLQREVLDFIEFPAQRVAEREATDEQTAWAEFSLAQAMRDLETEDSPAYTEADLKERWR